MAAYRILSLDGGGIRGYLSILLLEKLAELRPGFLEQIDLFAGTSTGSIIALALAYGKSPAEIRSLYESEGKNIFHDSLVDNIRDLGFALGAKFSSKNLKSILSGYFGDATLEDLKRRVLIASFDLDRPPTDDRPRMWGAKFFHNFPGEGSDGCQSVVDVALRSSAAPFYFPSYQGYVDGFVIANNPSMCALTQVIKPLSALEAEQLAKDEGTDVARLEDIALLSVGTGLNPRYIDDEKADWGWIKWMIQLSPKRQWYALPLVFMMWEGGIELANFQCRQFLGPRFHRLDPVLPELLDIDDVKRMNVLKQVALETNLQPTLGWVDEHFTLEVEPQVELKG
jgi:patatin-like phospholipase/acyl hydrolase